MERAAAALSCPPWHDTEPLLDFGFDRPVASLFHLEPRQGIPISI